MRTLFAAIIFLAVFISCKSDSDNTAIVTEEVTSSIILTIDIPPLDAANVIQSTSGIIQLNTAEIDSINGDITEIKLNKILLEIDEYSGSTSTLLNGNSIIFKDSDNNQLLGVDLTAADFNLDEYDQNNIILDVTIDDAETISAIEAELLLDEPFLVELTARVTEAPAKFDLVVQFQTSITGEMR